MKKTFILYFFLIVHLSLTFCPKADAFGRFADGDLDGNDYLSIGDVILGLRFVTGLDRLSLQQRRSSDLDLDGRTDINDLVKMLRIVTGLAQQTNPTIGPIPSGALLPTGQRIQLFGDVLRFPEMGRDLVVNHDGSLVAVMGSNSVFLLRPSDGRSIRRIKIGSMAMLGLCFSPDSSTLYVSTLENISSIDIASGQVKTISVPSASSRPTLPTGLAVSADGSSLLAVCNGTNEIVSINLSSGAIQMRIPVGVAPMAIALAGDGRTAYVTNYGGPQPPPQAPYALSFGSPVQINPVTGAPSSGSVDVVDLAQGRVVKSYPVAPRPCDLALDEQRRFLYVASAGADAITEVDLSTDLLRTVKVFPERENAVPFYTAPTGIDLSPDGRFLYVTLGAANAVSVFQRGEKGAVFESLIPTAWYPIGVKSGSKAGMIYVLSMKGDNNTDPVIPKKYAGSGVKGMLAVMDLSDEATRLSMSDIALQGAGMNSLPSEGATSAGPVQAILPRDGSRSALIRHVVYIIKENRTYDNILGDMTEGNGDPRLCMYGASITPNHHALARQFSLLDNYYASGLVSMDGHYWTDAAYTPDYLERQMNTYSRGYPFNGGDALAMPDSGFLWTSAHAHGLTFRSFGEMVYSRITFPGETWLGNFQSWLWKTGSYGVKNSPNGGGLKAADIDPDYPGFDVRVPDQVRADIFLKRLQQFEQTGQMPDFCIISLPNDHTYGLTPGYPTPEAYMADNDLALGKVIEGITHSRFWPDTAIFVTEDDAQSGYDHVDGHRTVGYVISPYTPRSRTISKIYTQVDMVRTIEVILGLPPLNGFDGAATPMEDCFQITPDLTPYVAIPNQVALTDLVPPISQLSSESAYWVKKSLGLNFNIDDAKDWDTLNRILWFATKGSSIVDDGITE